MCVRASGLTHTRLHLGGISAAADLGLDKADASAADLREEDREQQAGGAELPAFGLQHLVEVADDGGAVHVVHGGEVRLDEEAERACPHSRLRQRGGAA